MGRVPAASEQVAKRLLAHKGAGWLHNPCHRGSPLLQSGGQNHRRRKSGHGGYITLAAWVGGGSPPLQSGGQNQRWPTSWPGGYITLPACGVPNASERRQNQRWPTSGPAGYITLAACRGSPPLQRGGHNQRWPTSGHGGYITLPPWGVPHRFKAWGRIRGGPQVGRVAT